MRRKTLIVLSSAVLFALSVGTAVAYFAFTNRTLLGEFTTGSAQVEVIASSQPNTQLLPGERQTFSYTIQNIGTVPVHMRSFIEGVWSDPELDPESVSGVEMGVQRWHGSTEVVLDAPFSLSNLVYYSESGEDEAIWELQPQETWEVQVVVELDPDAGSEYMAATYALELVLGVKETSPSAPWSVM